VARIVQSVTRRHHHVGNVLLADGVHHVGRRRVRRVSNHLFQLMLDLAVETNLASSGLLASSQENRNLREAGGVHHDVAVELGDARMATIGDVDQRNAELLVADLPRQSEVVDGVLDTSLQLGVDVVPQRRRIRAVAERREQAQLLLDRVRLDVNRRRFGRLVGKRRIRQHEKTACRQRDSTGKEPHEPTKLTDMPGCRQPLWARPTSRTGASREQNRAGQRQKALLPISCSIRFAAASGWVLSPRDMKTSGTWACGHRPIRRQ